MGRLHGGSHACRQPSAGGSRHPQQQPWSLSAPRLKRPLVKPTPRSYFAYTVVGYRGTGMISYEQALAAVFVEGWIFVLLSVSGLRSGALTLVPRSTMLATAGGIGLFLAFIGLQKSEGLGVVVADPATLVSLGGCPTANQVKFYAPASSAPDKICSVGLFACGLVWCWYGCPT
jgi:xanthine/uracil/vitamin C permease (AzgA family)